MVVYNDITSMDVYNDITSIYDIWFNIINNDQVYNKENFIPFKNKLQQYISNVNIDTNQSKYLLKEEISNLQEELLDIIRDNMLQFDMDDIYNTILEHLIIKNIFELRLTPYIFSILLKERFDIFNYEIPALPRDVWLRNNYNKLKLFSNYFD